MTRRVAICVATYQRPELLDALLASLARQALPEEVEVEVRVVDNDPERSAAAVLADAPARHGLEVRAVFDAQRNLAGVRNAALALGPADLVAFVDDDEQADVDWLARLIETLDASEADAVFGPIVQVLDGPAPAWVERGGFLGRPVREGEVPWSWTRTGNALVRGRWIYAEGLRFDEQFGGSGGEDTDLFARLAQRGGRLVGEPRAIVREHVDPARLGLGELWRRHWRGGVNYARLASRQGGARHPLVQFGGRVALALRDGLKGLPRAAAGRPEAVIAPTLRLAVAGGGLAVWLQPGGWRRMSAYGEVQ